MKNSMAGNDSPKTRSQRIMAFVGAANQIIVFTGLCMALLFALLAAGERFIGHEEQKQVTADSILESSIAEGKKDSESTLSKRFSGKVGDTYIFKVTGAHRRWKEGSSLRGPSQSFRYSSPVNTVPTVNFIFVGPQQRARFLFEKNTMVNSYILSNVEKWKDQKMSCARHLYAVTIADTNKDGVLTEEDEQILYTSALDGTDLKEVMTDIDDYRVVGPDRVLIIKGKDGEREFYEYNVEEDVVTALKLPKI